MPRTVVDVFLSSTAMDLAPYRAALHARLSRHDMFHCTRMEDFGAQSTSAVAFCREKASKADMLVGLIGMRRGWEPDNDEQNRSITEIEQDAARDAGRKRYLWVSPENIPIPGNIPESPDAYQRQIQFRKRVMGAGDVIVAQDGFAQPELLAADIVTQLVTHVSTSELILAVRQDLTLKGRTSVDEQVPAITAAVARLAADNEIDPLNIPDKLTGVDLSDWEDKLRTRAEALETHWLAEKKKSAELWRHIGALAFLHDTDKALSAYSKATELDPRDLSGWRYLGELQFRLGNIRGAEDSFRTHVQLGRQLKDRRAEALGNLRLGWIERHRGQFSDARKLTEKALTISKEIGWTEGQARATTNLGNIQERLGQHADAAKSYSDALALNRALGRKQGLAIVYGNLGILQQGRGEPAAAEQSFRNSLKINKELERTDGIADAACNLGVLYQSRGDIQRAEDMYRKALAINESLDRRHAAAIVCRNLATLLHARGDSEEASTLLRQAEKLETRSGPTPDIAITLDGPDQLLVAESGPVQLTQIQQQQQQQ